MFPYRVKYTNPNPILKITISLTQTPQMPKYFREFGKCSKHRNNSTQFKLFKTLCCHMYKLYNSFLYFWKNPEYFPELMTIDVSSYSFQKCWRQMLAIECS